MAEKLESWSSALPTACPRGRVRYTAAHVSGVRAEAQKEPVISGIISREMVWKSPQVWMEFQDTPEEWETWEEQPIGRSSLCKMQETVTGSAQPRHGRKKINAFAMQGAQEGAEGRVLDTEAKSRSQSLSRLQEKCWISLCIQREIVDPEHNSTLASWSGSREVRKTVSHFGFKGWFGTHAKKRMESLGSRGGQGRKDIHSQLISKGKGSCHYLSVCVWLLPCIGQQYWRSREGL